VSRVLIVGDHADHYRQLLEPMGLPDWHASYLASAADAHGSMADVQILFGPPDELVSLLPRCPALQWVQSSWAGVTPLVEARRRDYQLTGVKGIFGELMREYVLGWLLALERNIPSRAEDRTWRSAVDGSLVGKCLGIMGTGSIGSAVAQAAQGFGLQIRGLNSDGRPAQGFHECFETAEAVAFAQGLDYLVALLPATDATNGLVSPQALAALNPGAVFINAGRANCVAIGDLETALTGGNLRAVVLDVLPCEPLPDDDPLWNLDNLYITSHTAAPTLADSVVAVFAGNYRRFVVGEPLLHAIDFDRGY
jgi:phosphoglycerate dehydrogenase-like enzyme